MKDGKHRTVSRTPAWLMKLKGRIDSKKGKGVCDEYLGKLAKKEAALESLEVIDAENKLFTTRKQGAHALTTLRELNISLASIPEDDGNTSTAGIRASRNNAAARSSAKAEMKAALEALSQINEIIVNIETIMDERIARLRSQTSEMGHVYVSGVRAGELQDYSNPIDGYDDVARKIYHDQHDELDPRIRSIVNIGMKEDVA